MVGIVSHMLQLDGLATLFVVINAVASLNGSTLLADDDVFELVWKLFLSLQAVEALSRVATLVLERVQQMSIVLQTGLLGRLRKIIVIDNHGEV